MLGSPAFGPVCGDSGEGVCVGKLPDSNPEVFAQSQPSPLLRKHSQPHYSKTKGGGIAPLSLHARAHTHTHTLLLDLPCKVSITA